MSADRHTLAADADELAFVELSIADAAGTVEMLADDHVELEVSGPAELIGFGTAAPATEESFTDNTHTTYRGRALAVLRPTGSAGDIQLTARSARHGRADTQLTAVRTHG
jgi:hypothetical protein